MDLERPLACCGIAELNGVEGNSPERIIKYVADEILIELNDPPYDNSDWNYQASHIIFSTTETSQSGKNLQAYIKQHKLGSCKKTPPRINPRSGNKLTVWVWTWSKKGLKAWYKTHNE